MKIPACLSIVLLLLARSLAPAAETVRMADPKMEIRYQRGDDPRWASPDWDDRDWQRTLPDRLFLPVHDGIYWVRFRLQRSDAIASRPVRQVFFWPRDEPDSPINSIFLAAPFTFELFWDGRPIWRNGVVGADRASEVPGRLDNLMPIPPELLGPGEHVAAVRVSTAHYNFLTTRAGFYFALENFADRLVYETRQPILPLVGAAGAILAAVFCVGLYWLVDRRRLLLLCAVLSLAVGVFYFLIAWRWLHNDTYDWFAPRLTTIAVTVTLICGLQAWLLLEQFAVARRHRWLAVLVPLVFAAWFSSPFHAVIVLWLYRAMLAFSIAVAGWAVWRRRSGARWVLGGALVGLAAVQPNWDARSFVGPVFLVTFGAQMLSVLIALGVQLGEDRRQARAAVLTAARLEIELLKKNIQPHFLLNTLASIIETIEQEPKTAVTLVEALAGEFRILSRVAGEKLIPLAQELELCRAHLGVMSQRRGVRCAFQTFEADEQALVPPAIFHTLVENGLTHLLPREGRIDFELRGQRLARATCYTLLACGERQAAAPGEIPRGGTGLRYIEARLEESFPERWLLRGEPVAEGWRTTIEIADAEKGAAA